MPLPAQAERGTGQLGIDQLFSLALTGPRDERIERSALRFLHDLSLQTGMPLNEQLSAPSDTQKPTLTVHIQNTGKKVQELDEDESYVLEIASSGGTLTAPNALGALHGLQTFLQLIAPTPTGFAVPVAAIHDSPRFPWRGLLIDSARHFIPLDVVKRTLDGMAAVKLNVLHWHLSDDEGFRVEMKKLPKLHEVGSDGQYYTQSEIRDVISYARDRGIRIVPEFDMPAHSRSWQAAYPELGSGSGPYPVGRSPVFDTALDPTRESTYKFLETFIAELTALFPDAYFHIGGDEVPNKPWDSNPKIQQFIHAHGMKSNRDLQAHFNQRLQKIVSKNGKIMVGWDEVLHPDLPTSIVVHSWRGQESLTEVAKRGYRGLLSYGYYLDLMWPASQHYAIDPMSGPAAALTPEEQKRILGGEACMWAEYVTPETIESRIWPRLAAIAERFWTPQSVTDTASMYRRMDEVSWRLGFLGITHESGYEPMLHRLAGSADIKALRTFADVVEPTKGYTRTEIYPQPPVKSTPLNRLADAARPESAVARHFAELVDSYIQSGEKDSAAEERIRAWLTKWHENHTALQTQMQGSFLFNDAQPLSEDFSSLAAAGLLALDSMDKGLPLPDSWRVDQRAIVERTQKPRANLTLAVAPAIQKLIEATAAKATKP
jgi:hexosaminidase